MRFNAKELMMTLFPIGIRANNFLQEFFEPLKKPASAEAVQYFSATFVPPPDHEQLVADIRPVSHDKRIVIFDGQARAGKTWSALGAICEILNEEPMTYWTTGQDSRALFTRNLAGGTVFAALEALSEKLSQHPQLIFLDDLLGTVRLRLLADNQEELRKVAEYLDCEQQYKLRSILPVGSTLIVTNRSALLTAAEAILRCRIRPTNLNEPSGEVIRVSRGVYRLKDGSIGGSFTSSQLSEIVQRHLSCVEFRIPEITIFAPEPPAALGARDISNVLFGADFHELVSEIKNLKNQLSVTSSGQAEISIVRKLDPLGRAYLLLIAPGLIFFGSATYTALGLSDQLTSDLSLRLEKGFVRYGRVPNEYYVCALGQHFKELGNIQIAAYVMTRTLANCSLRNRQIAVRGLLEQALKRLPLDKPVTTIESLAALLDQNPDPLFQWEIASDFADGSLPDLAFKPGFCSAVGWALNHFSNWTEAKRDKSAENVVSQFKTAFSNWPQLTHDEKEKVLASYSTFLQWVLQSKGLQSGIADKLASLVSTGDATFEDLIETILNDETVWAHIHPSTQAFKESEVMNRVFKRLKAESEGIAVPEKRSLANRLFTLAWHNEWMRDKAGTRSLDCKRWLDNLQANAESTIRDEPTILDWNLQYHWRHFITQYCVWMRNWCFSEDPIGDEWNRVAPGSPEPDDNQLFLNLGRLLLTLVSDSPEYCQRLRNYTMLLGTRTARLPAGCTVTSLVNADQFSPAMTAKILEAIFELGRQGFLDEDSHHSSKDFREWCFRVFERASQVDRKEAWSRYKQELEEASYLDLLPETLNEVLPSEWHQEAKDEAVQGAAS